MGTSPQPYEKGIECHVVRDSFVLCCVRTSVHMELQKRTLKVREMVEAEQEADGSKGADVESPKRCVKCEQREWDRG